MRNYYSWLFKQLVFWLGFFTLNRFCWLTFQFERLSDVAAAEILKVAVYAFPLDLSAIAYLIAVPLLLSFIQVWTNRQFYVPFLKVYMGLMIFLIAVVSTADSILFDEWGAKIDFKALTYLKQPAEVFSSASNYQTMQFFFMLIVQVLIGYWVLYKKIFPTFKVPAQKPRWYSFAFYFLSTIAYTVLTLRGGLQQIPINQSSCYFSKSNVLNTATINSSWGLLQSVLENVKTMGENIYKVMDDSTAEDLVKALYVPPVGGNGPIVLTSQRPNIVFFVLESWSADVCAAFNGGAGFSKSLDSLASQGVSFTHLFASGMRSDQGIMAIYSGYPSQPINSIITQPSKFATIPSLVNVFKNNGYYSSFYFGGQLSYGNIKSYMKFHGMDKITEIDDYDGDIPQGKLGVHDEFVLDRMLREMDGLRQPFFTSFFNTSTHGPFDHPEHCKLKDFKCQENKYLNAVIYADSCIGSFMKKAANTAWFKNTLFVFVADHGHPTHRECSFRSAQYHHIPFFIYGPVIKDEYRGKQITKTGSQTDIAATLLRQFSIDASAFKWSRNLLHPAAKEFAYGCFNNGLVWVTPTDTFEYDYQMKTYFHKRIKNPADSSKVLMEGKAYLQTLFNDYQKR